MSEEELIDLGFTDLENAQFKKKFYKWIFLDSCRLFPVSLNEFCKIFGVEGKKGSYNSNWNNITLFDDEVELSKFIEYSLQDSISLLNAIIKARNVYLEIYQVDITRVVSTPSLSLLIYRKKFQPVNIPILKRKLDNQIRDSYFGGSSDYYKLHGTNLKYYDVNSLYPYAMLNDMPLNFIGEFSGSHFKLDEIFGFVDCIVESPKNIKEPLLIARHEGKIIHPNGKWRGVYFSEEIKQIISFGYKVEINKIYQFSRAKLFVDYVDHFYEKKKNSVGAERFIAKLHLNTLYGMFGRKLDMLKTIPIRPDELIEKLSIYPIKSIIDINEKLKILLTYQNLDYKLIKKLNIDLSLRLIPPITSIVKSNVAIASAITSYARIEMMKYKSLPDIDIYYSDTDSIFVNKNLPENMVGKELGQMKDELGGGVIKEAYFFGIKKYGYLDDKDKTKTIFSGIPRNSISWNEIIDLSKGISINKTIPDQFFKYLNKLQINIKHKNVLVEFKPDKKLVDNNYIPLFLKDTSTNNFNGTFKYLYNKIKKFMNKIF